MLKILTRTVGMVGRRPWRSLASTRVSPQYTSVPGRMFSLQESLPRLPVPALEQTMNKFLAHIQPVVSDEEFKHAEKVVADFARNGGIGEKLQTLLVKRAEEKVNWLSDWWVDVAYLTDRMPIPIHCSPGIMLPPQEFMGQQDQLKYGAKLISGVLDYKAMIDDQSLPVEYLGKQPLCMHQFYKILTSCRVPGLKKDNVVNFPPDQPNPPRHIVVAHNNHFFSVDVYDPEGKPLKIGQIQDQLLRVVEMSQEPGIPVGILTSDSRNSWGQTYAKLIKDKQNKASVDAIQRSIFMLCLDQPISHSPDDRQSVIAGQMNHGQGSKWNSCNRWFDKTLEFIVGCDGAVGLNYEHAPAEGPPIISLMDHMLDYITKHSEDVVTISGSPEPQQLSFNITPEIESAIETAKLGMDSVIEDLGMTAFTFTPFGKNFVKSQKLSPDAFIQVCIQLAHYRIHGYNVPSYESGSLRRFQLGRTETIRGCTPASDKFVRAMDDRSLSPESKVELLRNAITAHRQYTGEVMNGQGIDRHLLGLKMIAIDSGMDVPEFHMDPIYSSNSQWRLSTSQVPSKNNATLCFGPVVPNGYGICYNPMPDCINFSTTTWNSCPETDSGRMKDNLEKSLIDSHDLLRRTQKSQL